MITLITHIIDIVLPVLLGYIVWILKEERSDRKATSLGMKELLGYMIDRWYEEFILQGYVTTEQRNNFDNIYKAYAANNGNGARQRKWQQVQSMNIDDTKSGVSPYLQLLLESRKKETEKRKHK